MKKPFARLFTKPIPMLVPLADSPLAKRITTMSPSWIVDEPKTLTGLLRAADKLRLDHPNHRALISLDDLGQALYTSGHAIDSHDLNAISEADIATLPKACFDDDGYLNYFTTPHELPFRLANLLREGKDVVWSDVHDSQPWDDCKGKSLSDANRDPDSILNGPTLIQMVPVAHCWQVIAAMPNGYFHSDWTPPQTLAVARHLEETFGACLIGMGASWVAFDLANVTDRTGLARDIAALYEAPEAGETTLIEVLADAPFAMLRYTG